MDNSSLSDVLELEEWNVRSLQRIEPRFDVLSLSNQTGNEVEESTLADALERVQGREGLKSLVLEHSSKLKNLLFLKALPSLETLQLYGHQLRSLDGLEWFSSGVFVEIKTEKNRQRNIGKIAEAPITKLAVQWANPGDQEAIALSRTIRHLELSNCPKLSLDRWSEVPIKSMQLWGGAIDVLTDTARLGRLDDLTLCGHRHLERFEGDNGNITWMVIQDCNRLDWRTIITFGNLAHLTVVGNNSEMPLSAFQGLRQLRTLSLTQSQVLVDVKDLKSSATHLEKLHITGLKQEQVADLSLANRGVWVSNGRCSYKDGQLFDR